MPKPKPCTFDGCDRPKKAANPRWCYWHWLARQPAAVQVTEAGKRLREARLVVGFVETGRVPKDEWPEGHRWCSGCQGFVPLFYTTGSRCSGCASKASHKSHVERTYNLGYDEYEALLAFQGGRCYICGQKPGARRLAVDHDHVSGQVRGLLCASDEWGCNVNLRRILGDLDAARRLLRYVERSPLERMRDQVEAQTGSRVFPTGTPVATRSSESPQERPAGGDWTSDPDWDF